MLISYFFFFNDTATTEIYTLSLHDALPISLPCTAAGTAWKCCAATARPCPCAMPWSPARCANRATCSPRATAAWCRSEEHTSELQSHSDLVCRLLLEKKKQSPATVSHTEST